MTVSEFRLDVRRVHLRMANEAKRAGDKERQRFNLTMAKHHLGVALEAAVADALAA